jgi:hypothetical protein
MNTPEKHVIDAILTVARREKKATAGVACYNFEVVHNPFSPNHLFLRFIRENAQKEERDYAFCCFTKNGQELDCKPVFADFTAEARYSHSFLKIIDLNV